MAGRTKKIDVKEYGMVFALVAIFLLFAILTEGNNASPMNINNLIMQNGYVIILAVGMLLCVLTGNVDLGVGSVVAVCGAASAIAVVDWGMPVPVGIILALVVGLLFGLFNGFFVAYLKIPPFTVTLATMLIGRGLTYTVLKAQTKGPLPDSFRNIATSYIFPNWKISIPMGEEVPNILDDGTVEMVQDMLNINIFALIVALVVTVALFVLMVRNRKKLESNGFENVSLVSDIVKNVIIAFFVWFVAVKLAFLKGIPTQLVIIAVIVACYAFLTEATVPGRNIYALGGNSKAARLSGINTQKVFFWVYANMSILAAVAGVVLSARNASATPKAGDGFEMDAIASCYIGGAAVAGGSGKIIGAVVGALVMGVLNNGMSLVGLSTDIQKIVKGVVLLGAVTADLISKQKKN